MRCKRINAGACAGAVQGIVRLVGTGLGRGTVLGCRAGIAKGGRVSLRFDAGLANYCPITSEW